MMVYRGSVMFLLEATIVDVGSDSISLRNLYICTFTALPVHANPKVITSYLITCRVLPKVFALTDQNSSAFLPCSVT